MTQTELFSMLLPHRNFEWNKNHTADHKKHICMECLLTHVFEPWDRILHSKS